MLQHARCSLTRTKESIPHRATEAPTSVMSDEELRRQIYGMSISSSDNDKGTPANDKEQQTPQFSSRVPRHSNPIADFKIVLALCPVCTADGRIDSPAQYAMLVRRAPSGEYVPLLKGEAFGHAAPWTKPLQSLFSTSAKAIHLKFVGTRVPLFGTVEQLPRYQPADSDIAQ